MFGNEAKFSTTSIAFEANKSMSLGCSSLRDGAVHLSLLREAVQVATHGANQIRHCAELAGRSCGQEEVEIE